MARTKTKKATKNNLFKSLDAILTYVSPMRTFILVLFISTVLSGLIYLSIQQVLRQTANDPQIQIAEDVADSLSQGADPSQIIPNYTFDISKSLSTFVIVTDGTGKVVASTATLDGKTPQMPKGVLDYTKAHGQDRLTWQPKTGVRTATIVNYYNNSQTKASGYVIVGKSLREVEKRVSQLALQVGIAWALTLIGSVFIILVLKNRDQSK